MTHYDYILAGGGSAGLNLAYALTHSPLRDRSILIIEPDAKDTNDRTWCSWLIGPHPYEDILYRSWEHLQFISDDFSACYRLAPYRYTMLRGIDFYNFVHADLAQRPNVEILRASVDSIEDNGTEAKVRVGNLELTADWVFDSRFRIDSLNVDNKHYHNLKQHFLGWEIETAQPVFNPHSPTMFDFRTPQNGAMRFMYVLPFTEYRGLVEYTLFSANILSQDDYEAALRVYIQDVLGATDYHILSTEQDMIPMTDQPFPRQAGKRILNIGTRGGRVKASTGYAFLRTQRDTVAAVDSLVRHGHPFDIPQTPRRYRAFDSILLQVLYRQGDLSKRIFTYLFRGNPVGCIFRFLDEAGGIGDNVLVMTSVPSWPFMRALFRLYILHRI
ncbi:MAG: Lycopene cyclase [Anaerolineae bacterium]|nr:Lycopene cyclase [Anaerolineae bacterium]